MKFASRLEARAVAFESSLTSRSMIGRGSLLAPHCEVTSPSVSIWVRLSEIAVARNSLALDITPCSCSGKSSATPLSARGLT